MKYAINALADEPGNTVVVYTNEPNTAKRAAQLLWETTQFRAVTIEILGSVDPMHAWYREAQS